MSIKQIVISGKNLVKLLEKIWFEVVRINGSHNRMKHIDGRVTTIPVHKNNDIPIGLLRKIIKEDLEISIQDFENLINEENI